MQPQTSLPSIWAPRTIQVDGQDYDTEYKIEGERAIVRWNGQERSGSIGNRNPATAVMTLVEHLVRAGPGNEP